MSRVGRRLVQREPLEVSVRVQTLGLHRTPPVVPVTQGPCRRTRGPERHTGTRSVCSRAVRVDRFLLSLGLDGRVSLVFSEPSHVHTLLCPFTGEKSSPCISTLSYGPGPTCNWLDGSVSDLPEGPCDSSLLEPNQDPNEVPFLHSKKTVIRC